MTAEHLSFYVLYLYHRKFDKASFIIDYSEVCLLINGRELSPFVEYLFKECEIHGYRF
ncbi:hypothetical protein J2Y73_004601 [Peribacillus frigoritolerans]|nr:hypothetical protein [Peribacillus frigoritolerans]